MNTITLKSNDIHCNACAKSIKAVVGSIHGVDSVEVDIEGKAVAVSFGDPATETQIRAAMETAGFDIEE